MDAPQLPGIEFLEWFQRQDQVAPCSVWAMWSFLRPSSVGRVRTSHASFPWRILTFFTPWTNLTLVTVLLCRWGVVGAAIWVGNGTVAIIAVQKAVRPVHMYEGSIRAVLGVY